MAKEKFSCMVTVEGKNRNLVLLTPNVNSRCRVLLKSAVERSGIGQSIFGPHTGFGCKDRKRRADSAVRFLIRGRKSYHR
jgi:hypothetical protein